MIREFHVPGRHELCTVGSLLVDVGEENRIDVDRRVTISDGFLPVNWMR